MIFRKLIKLFWFVYGVLRAIWFAIFNFEDHRKQVQIIKNCEDCNWNENNLCDTHEEMLYLNITPEE